MFQKSLKIFFKILYFKNLNLKFYKRFLDALGLYLNSS